MTDASPAHIMQPQRRTDGMPRPDWLRPSGSDACLLMFRTRRLAMYGTVQIGSFGRQLPQAG